MLSLSFRHINLEKFVPHFIFLVLPLTDIVGGYSLLLTSLYSVFHLDVNFYLKAIALNQIGWHSILFIIYGRRLIIYSSANNSSKSTINKNTTIVFLGGYERNYWKFAITWKIEGNKINKFRRTSDVKKKIAWKHLNQCEICDLANLFLTNTGVKMMIKWCFLEILKPSLVESHYYCFFPF